MKPKPIELRHQFHLLCYWLTNYTQIGKEYSVSDNCVRKRFKKEGMLLPKKQRGTRKYTCSYCRNNFVDDVSREKDSKSGHFFCDTGCKGKFQKENKNVF